MSFTGFFNYATDLNNICDAVIIYCLYTILYTFVSTIVKAFVASYKEVMKDRQERQQQQLNGQSTEFACVWATPFATPLACNIDDQPAIATMTVRKLKGIARKRGIKRYSSLRKPELIEALAA